MTCILHNLADPVAGKDDSPPAKYWITDLAKLPTKSPYALKFTLIQQPSEWENIRKWLHATFKGEFFIREYSDNPMYFAEIFFKKESDTTMFILMWGESFV